MTVALIALVALSESLSGARTSTVTFESKAERVERLLPELAKALEMRLEANGPVADEVLLVRFTDLPRQRVLDEIALATDGRWTPMEGGLRLTRDVEAVRKREAQEASARGKALQRSAEEFRTQSLAATFDATEATNLARELSKPRATVGGPIEFADYLAMQRPLKRTPGSRLLARILPMVDWTLVATTAESEPITFAYPANPLQVALPAGPAASAIQEFLAEQKLWVDSGSIVPETQWEARQSLTEVSAVQKVIVVLRSYGQGQAGASLYVKDARGKMLSMASQTILEEHKMIEMQKSAEKAMSDASPFPFSPLAQSMIEYLAKRQADPSTPMPPQVAEALFNPSRIEPLSIVPSEVLMAGLGKADNLVANVPDMILAWTLPVHGPPLAPAMAKILVERMMNRQEAEGVVRLRGDDSMVGSAWRVDRRVWQALADEARTTGTTSIDTRAAAAAQAGSPREYGLAMVLPDLLSSTVGMAEGDFYALRLYGAIPAAQRIQLRQGAPISFGQMSAGMKAAFRDLVLSGSLSYHFGEYAVGQEHLMAVPTELFPNGIPPTTQLSATFDDSDPLFFPAHRSEQGYVVNLRRASIKDIAERLYAKENPGKLSWVEMMGTETKLYTGKGLKVTLKLVLGAGLSATSDLLDNRPNFSRLLDLADLSPEIRKQVQEALEQTRETYKGMQSGGRTGNPPPPR